MSSAIKLMGFPWSSHQAYAGKVTAPQWLSDSQNASFGPAALRESGAARLGAAVEESTSQPPLGPGVEEYIVRLSTPGQAGEREFAVRR